MSRAAALAAVLALAACGDDAAVAIDAPLADAAVEPADAAPDAPAAPMIVPGERVGAIALGTAWGELRAALGDPPSDPPVLSRLAVARWPALGVEVLVTSPEDAALTDDALVIGVAATAAGDLDGPVVPGATRAAIEAALGAPPEAYGGRVYYPAGLVVEYGDDDVAAAIAVVEPYTLAPEPPPMQPAQTTRPPAPPTPPPRPREGGIVVDGRTIRVVDMHLHPGDYGAMAATGKAFISGSLPPFLQRYTPALLDRLSDPWAPHVGIRAQTESAGIDHAVLYAVYTQRTTGYLTNERLEQLLDDPRNGGAGEDPWAWGMASINFDGWTEDLAGDRLAALRSYFEARPDRFVGIKLAHAHQAVTFSDAEYQGVYQLAGELGVPVLLHTGFSPFPGAQDDPAYYDPLHLEAVVTAFDGAHGLPRVDFVLSHVGQGDARATAHALDLAEDHDNVWLELSALGRPLLVGADGEPVTSTDPQYPAVLAAIAERGLVGRTLFATDGPQGSGTVRTYLTRLVDGMQDAGYSLDDIEAVLGGNFARLFLDRDAL